MTNINDMHRKADYIEAIDEERFSEIVAQQESDALLRRRALVVLIVSALMCAIATLMLSY